MYITVALATRDFLVMNTLMRNQSLLRAKFGQAELPLQVILREQNCHGDALKP
jgi:hypothetical protein